MDGGTRGATTTTTSALPDPSSAAGPTASPEVSPMSPAASGADRNPPVDHDLNPPTDADSNPFPHPSPPSPTPPVSHVPAAAAAPLNPSSAAVPPATTSPSLPQPPPAATPPGADVSPATATAASTPTPSLPARFPGGGVATQARLLTPNPSVPPPSQPLPPSALAGGGVGMASSVASAPLPPSSLAAPSAAAVATAAGAAPQPHSDPAGDGDEEDGGNPLLLLDALPATTGEDSGSSRFDGGSAGVDVDPEPDEGLSIDDLRGTLRSVAAEREEALLWVALLAAEALRQQPVVMLPTVPLTPPQPPEAAAVSTVSPAAAVAHNVTLPCGTPAVHHPVGDCVPTGSAVPLDVAQHAHLHHALRHPHLVPVLGAGMVPAPAAAGMMQPGVLVPHTALSPLQHHLNGHVPGVPPLPPTQRLAALLSTARALAFLHSRQPAVVHGRVCAAAVVLDRGGHPPTTTRSVSPPAAPSPSASSSPPPPASPTTVPTAANVRAPTPPWLPLSSGASPDVPLWRVTRHAMPSKCTPQDDVRAFGALVLQLVTGASSTATPAFAASVRTVVSAINTLSRSASSGTSTSVFSNALCDVIGGQVDTRCGEWPPWLAESLCVIGVGCLRAGRSGQDGDPEPAAAGGAGHGASGLSTSPSRALSAAGGLPGDVVHRLRLLAQRYMRRGARGSVAYVAAFPEPL